MTGWIIVMMAAAIILGSLWPMVKMLRRRDVSDKAPIAIVEEEHLPHAPEAPPEKAPIVFATINNEGSGQPSMGPVISETLNGPALLGAPWVHSARAIES